MNKENQESAETNELDDIALDQIVGGTLHLGTSTITDTTTHGGLNLPQPIPTDGCFTRPSRPKYRR